MTTDSFYWFLSIYFFFNGSIKPKNLESGSKNIDLCDKRVGE